MDEHERLKQQLKSQAERIRKADRDRPTLMQQTAYIGVLGLLFVLPVVLGAYLGSWLDSGADSYSSRWTVSLILIGVFVGGMNVYLFISDKRRG